ncbi:MAG: hypothetical protein ABL930_02025 [Pseudobdellovibrio sp.]
MKNKYLFYTLFILVCLSVGYAQHFWRGEEMSLARIEKKWGHSDFSAEKFKAGNKLTRASMAYSLIKQNKYLGKSILDIKAELGDFNGYYFSEAYPTYLINEPQKKGDDVWQIVFLLDKNRLISSVIVHKNCCYK